MPIEARKHWISILDPLVLTRQCELAGIARSATCALRSAAKPDEQELALLALIDAEYTRPRFSAAAR